MKKLLLVLAIVLFANVVRAEGFGFCLGPKVGYQTTKLSLEKAEIKKGFSDHLTIGVFGRITICTGSTRLMMRHSGATIKQTASTLLQARVTSMQEIVMPSSHSTVWNMKAMAPSI